MTTYLFKVVLHMTNKKTDVPYEHRINVCATGDLSARAKGLKYYKDKLRVESEELNYCEIETIAKVHVP